MYPRDLKGTCIGGDDEGQTLPHHLLNCESGLFKCPNLQVQAPEKLIRGQNWVSEGVTYVRNTGIEFVIELVSR